MIENKLNNQNSKEDNLINYKEKVGEAKTDNYKIKIAVFEGPFDLLLHLIDQNEVDIYDIPIAKITAQYLDYIQSMQKLDLNITSEFLVMAATLLSIKTKTLLPPEKNENDEEKDAREELVYDLLEYKKFKAAALNLENFAEKEKLFVARPNVEELYSKYFSEENPLEGKTVSDLTIAFKKIWEEREKKEEIHAVKKQDITISGQMNIIVDKLQGQSDNFNNMDKGLNFEKIFVLCQSKIELIITFLGLLELIRMAAVKVKQEAASDYSEIYIKPRDLSNYPGYEEQQNSK